MFTLRLKPKLNSLCRAFSKIHSEQPQKTTSFAFMKDDITNLTSFMKNSSTSTISFTTQSIGLNINGTLKSLIPMKEILDIPALNKIIQIPYSSKIIEINEGNSRLSEMIEPPKGAEITGIQAARLIIIRRKKMKKHKLKKLRKKMKFEWAKVRQRREMRKEKAFQAGLIGQIKEAEKFSAEKYVSDKIAQATEVPIPRFWKGKRLPEFIIKQKLGLK